MGRLPEALQLRKRPAAVVAGALLAAVVLVLAIAGLPNGHRNTGDTDNLVAGTRVALDCLHLQDLTACGATDARDSTAVGPYPLLQYLPAAVLVKAGLDDGDVLRGLTVVSLLSFVAVLGLCWAAARRLEWRGWGPLLLATMLASPLVYQSTSAFGEMFAAAVALAAVVAALHRRPWLMALGALAAPLGKETLLPFVVLMMLLVARERRDGWLPPLRLTMPVVAGAVCSAVLTFGFNVFRLDSLSNTQYLNPLFRTPGVGRKAEFTLAIWVAPNGGMTWFWPLAAIIFVATGVIALLRLVRREGPRSWMPPLVGCGLVIAFSIGLGAWVSPFGWLSYGNRLMVPIVPAAVVVCVVVAERELTRGARAIVNSRALIPAALLVAVAAFPQVRAAWSAHPAILTILEPDATCPAPPIVQEDKDLYYFCTSHSMWRLEPSMIEAAAVDGELQGLYGGLLGALTAGSLVLAAGEVGAKARDRPSEDEPRPQPVA